MNLRDTFSDADGTELSTHTMNQGNGWAKIGGEFQISGGMLAGKTGNPNPLYLADAAAPFGTLMVTPTVALADEQIALHLAKDYQSRFGYVLVCYPSTSKIEIYTTGTANVLSLQQTHAFVSGKQQWRAKVTDNDITFFIAGQPVAFLGGIAPTNGWWGLEMYHPNASPLSTVSRFHFID